MSGSEALIDTRKFKGKMIAIVGIGGLGCTVSMLLARQGINLMLIDGDIVEKSNLERQVLFDVEDIGKPKSEVAARRLECFSEITSVFDTITEKNTVILDGADLIIDCTDNMETRMVIDNFSREKRVPWIHSAGVKEIGTLFFIDPSREERATFKDFAEGKEGESACSVGVMNTTVSIVGALAAKMAVDYLTKGSYPEGMMRVDLSGLEISQYGVKKDG